MLIALSQANLSQKETRSRHANKNQTTRNGNQQFFTTEQGGYEKEEKSSQILSLARSVACARLISSSIPSHAIPLSLSPAAAPIPNRDSRDGGHRRRQQDPQRQAGEQTPPHEPSISSAYIPVLLVSSPDFGQLTLVQPEESLLCSSPNGMAACEFPSGVFLGIS
jgi:hypothetical protein